MSYQVSVADVAARPTVVVATTTTWQEFPLLWMELLNEVWSCLRAGGIDRGCDDPDQVWTEVYYLLT